MSHFKKTKMSTLMQPDTIAIFDKDIPPSQRQPIIVENITDADYKTAFLSQTKFSLKGEYCNKFKCGDFCELTLAIAPQIIENRKAIQTIKDIYKSLCETDDTSYKELSVFVFIEFFERVSSVVKNMVTSNHDLVINKLFNNANLEFDYMGVVISINFKVCNDYIVEKDSEIVSIDKFKELNGVYPDFESWELTKKNSKIKIGLLGEAYLVKK